LTLFFFRLETPASHLDILSKMDCEPEDEEAIETITKIRKQSEGWASMLSGAKGFIMSEEVSLSDLNKSINDIEANSGA